MYDVKEIARMILEDSTDSNFNILYEGELRALYGQLHTECPIPSTACCARDQARRVLGEPEATQCSIRSLKRYAPIPQLDRGLVS